MQRLFKASSLCSSTLRNTWQPRASFSTYCLDDTHLQFKEKVARFAKEYIAPHASIIDQTKIFPTEPNLWKLMGNFNLLGITAPEEYGGKKLGCLYHCLAMEEISRAAASVGQVYGTHSSRCIDQLVRNGTHAQKEKYLPKLISGDHVGSIAFREPIVASNALGMKCKADRVDGGYILNGTKLWKVNGPVAQTMVAYAKTDIKAGSIGLTAFIIEKGMPGFSTAQKSDKHGMRGNDTREFVFEDCFVPEENVLGQEGRGDQVMLSGLNLHCLVLACGPLGIMQACLDVVLPYLKQREQPACRSTGNIELTQEKLADIYTSLQSSRSYIYSVARDCDNGKSDLKDCAGVMLFAAVRASQVALKAVQCLLGNGYVNDYSIGRLLRDAKRYDLEARSNRVDFRHVIITQELLKSN